MRFIKKKEFIFYKTFRPKRTRVFVSVLVLAVALSGLSLYSFFIKNAYAATCGGAVVCSCGDTVTSDYTLTNNLSCGSGNTHGLIIGASGITIDGNGYSITKNNPGSGNYYGIYNDSHSNVTVKNFSNITGRFDSGIYFTGASSGGVIQNNTITSNDERGIYFNSTGGHSILSNTINSNKQGGVRIANSSGGSTISGNTISSNDGYVEWQSGIFIDNSDSNIIANNTLANNSSNTWTRFANGGGNIFLRYSAGNTLTGNAMTTNTGGFNLEVNVNADLADFNHNIDTTNTVEGKPVYYLYNQSDQVYDGNIIGSIGMFWCISCTNVTVKNAVLSPHNKDGVFFQNTTGSTIDNVVASNSVLDGIRLKSSSGNTISNSTSNYNGINQLVVVSGIYFISDGGGNTLTSNTTNFNSSNGVNVYSGTGNVFTGNTASYNGVAGINLGTSGNTLNSNILLNNKNAISGNISTNTYVSNQFLYNTGDGMITFNEVTRAKNLNDSVDFSINMKNAKNSACSSCTYSITTSPAETVAANQSGDNVTGSFTATKPGTYSLLANVTDTDGNVTKDNYYFYIASTTSTIRYYPRLTHPTHGQAYGNGSDAVTLLTTAPTSSETIICSGWIGASPDSSPVYPMSFLTSADTHLWYSAATTGTTYLGFNKLFNYGWTNPSIKYLIPNTVYPNLALVDHNFALNWSMDNFYDWYRMEMKMRLSTVDDTRWVNDPSQLSYTDFNITHTNTPAVKSASNENLYILSATALPGDTSASSIVLLNPHSYDTTTTLTLNGNRPFLDIAHTINADSTMSFTAPSVSAGQTLTVNNQTDIPITPASGSVDAIATASLIDIDYQNSTIAGLSVGNIDREADLNNNGTTSLNIIPSSGSVDLSVETWNTSGYKKWTETSATPSATTNHTIGNLVSGRSYYVKVNGSTIETLQANGSGQISFNYTGGYSAKTFEVGDSDYTLDTPSINNVNVLAKNPSLSSVFSFTIINGNPSATGKVNFQIATDSGFTNIISSGSSLTGLANNQTGSWTSPYTSFVAGNTYYWRAQNEDSYGNQPGSWSSSKTMTVVTLDTPSASNINVLAQSPSLSGTFSVSQVTNPSPIIGKVNFQIATDSGFSNVVSSGSSSTGLAHGQTGSWTSPYTSFVAGNTYYWRAQNEDSYGNQSSWSSSKTMTVVTPDTPSTSDTSVSVSSPSLYATFSASQVPNPSGATGKVNFQIATGSGFTNIISSGSSLTGLAHDQTGSWTSPYASFEEGGTYYWRAQNEDSYGNQSPWSAIREMNINCSHSFCETFESISKKSPSTTAGWVDDSEGKLVRNIGDHYDESSVANGFIGNSDNYVSGDSLYILPFNFPYYDNHYDAVYMNQFGNLSFDSSFNDPSASISEMSNHNMISVALIGDYIFPNGAYVYQPTSDSVAFYWNLYNDNWGALDSYEIILYRDGRIKFNFGTIDSGGYDRGWMGLFKGDGFHYKIASIKDDWLAQPYSYSNGSSLLFLPMPTGVVGDTAESTKLNSSSRNIAKATLYKNDTGTVEYYLSNNGGVTWESVTPGLEHTFSSKGNDIRWKAVLVGSEVYSINIDWEEEPLSNPVDSIIALAQNFYSSFMAPETAFKDESLAEEPKDESDSAFDYLKKAREAPSDSEKDDFQSRNIVNLLILGGGSLAGVCLATFLYKRFKKF